MRRAARLTRLLPLLFVLPTGCSRRGILDPQGPAADRIEGLWWLMFAISAVVFVVVVVLLGAAIVRGRRSKDDELVREEGRWPVPFIVIAGAVIPTIVLIAVFFVSLRDLNALAASDEDGEVEIEVVARDWWWEVRYPDAGAVTANEIHIPAGERVAIHLTTGDVIHSFWVPQLQVKMDAVNGVDNRLWLEADRPGRYRGICAEFCGLQHANMVFYVVAESREDYEEWLAGEAADAPVPVAGELTRGREVFLGNTCAGCHAIRGTEAAGESGPDLTHLAARDTIAAGTLTLNEVNLRRFIMHPQDIKPGVSMPPISLPDEDLDALVAYLMSLE